MPENTTLSSIDISPFLSIERVFYKPTLFYNLGIKYRYLFIVFLSRSTLALTLQTLTCDKWNVNIWCGYRWTRRFFRSVKDNYDEIVISKVTILHAASDKCLYDDFHSEIFTFLSQTTFIDITSRNYFLFLPENARRIFSVSGIRRIRGIKRKWRRNRGKLRTHCVAIGHARRLHATWLRIYRRAEQGDRR